MTLSRSFRFTETDIDSIRELAGYWGGLRPETDADTLREAVRRCLAIERAARSGRGGKKSAKSSQSVATGIDV